MLRHKVGCGVGLYLRHATATQARVKNPRHVSQGTSVWKELKVAMGANSRVKISMLRKYMTYAVIPAIASLALADRVMIDKYPGARIDPMAPQPATWMVYW